jgi:hypothetical protein
MITTLAWAWLAAVVISIVLFLGDLETLFWFLMFVGVSLLTTLAIVVLLIR